MLLLLPLLLMYYMHPYRRFLCPSFACKRTVCVCVRASHSLRLYTRMFAPSASGARDRLLTCAVVCVYSSCIPTAICGRLTLVRISVYATSRLYHSQRVLWLQSLCLLLDFPKGRQAFHKLVIVIPSTS